MERVERGPAWHQLVELMKKKKGGGGEVKESGKGSVKKWRSGMDEKLWVKMKVVDDDGDDGGGWW